jgi:hypothetical protein
MKMTQNRSRIADGAWKLSFSFQPRVLLLAVVISIRVVIWRGLLDSSLMLFSEHLSALFATLKLCCISVYRNGNGEISLI